MVELQLQPSLFYKGRSKFESGKNIIFFASAGLIPTYNTLFSNFRYFINRREFHVQSAIGTGLLLT